MEKTFAFTPLGKKWHKRKKPSGRHSLGSIWPPHVTLNFIQMDDSHLKRVFWKILNDAHALNGCKTQPRAGTKRANSGGTEVKKATGVVIQHSKIKSRGRIQVGSSELTYTWLSCIWSIQAVIKKRERLMHVFIGQLGMVVFASLLFVW